MALWTEGRLGWGVVDLLVWVTETGHLPGATTEVTEVASTMDPHVVEAEEGSIRMTKVGHPSEVGLAQVAPQGGVGLAVLEASMDLHPSAPQMDLVVLLLATLQVWSMSTTHAILLFALKEPSPTIRTSDSEVTPDCVLVSSKLWKPHRR